MAGADSVAPIFEVGRTLSQLSAADFRLHLMHHHHHHIFVYLEVDKRNSYKVQVNKETNKTMQQ